MDAELFRLDAVIRWLDAADGRIKRAAPDENNSDENNSDENNSDENNSDQTNSTAPAGLPRLRRGTRTSR